MNAPSSTRRRPVSFLILVVLPTLVAALYYGLIASEVYISESRFVVRSPDRGAATGITALLQGSALNRAQDDAFSVIDYIESRDALIEIDKRLGVRKVFSDAAIDPINRFPGPPWWDDSFESLYLHYLDRVRVDYNSSTSVSTLTVRAHTAQSARQINDELLKLGEGLVNELNARIRRDLIDVAERDVQRAEERARLAAISLAEFRSKRDVFDPNAQSALQLQGVGKLREELLAAESQLSQLRKVSPNNPQVNALRSRVEELRGVIARESARVTGSATSLSSKAPTYERLVLEKSFAEQQLAASMASVEAARREASRKQLYLERLVQPNEPDKAMEPRRARGVLVVAVLSLFAWGVFSLLIAAIREHRD
ncbi:MAG: hypothetical protein ACK4F7_00200 [Inhella sp.]